MQTSGIAGNSAAWALRQLFQPQQSAGQSSSAAGQSLPSGGASAGAAALAGPPLSQGTLSTFLGLQAQQSGQPAQPDFAELASQLLSSLDSNGDGAISQSEAEASGNANADQAFAALDTNGDGSISSDELSNALQSANQAHRAYHHGHHHGPSAAGAASSIINALNTDGEDGLSADEVSSALSADASSSGFQSAFSSLDSNGDGVLSLSELTSAINQYLQTRLSSDASLQQPQTAAPAISA